MAIAEVSQRVASKLPNFRNFTLGFLGGGLFREKVARKISCGISVGLRVCGFVPDPVSSVDDRVCGELAFTISVKITFAMRELQRGKGADRTRLWGGDFPMPDYRASKGVAKLA